jgi:hypothetical protein
MYEVKELSAQTWPDFERLFTAGNGWDHCWCMAFQQSRLVPASRFPTRAAQAVVNRADKERLVSEGRAHGILVYADGVPVGWCQFGPGCELRAHAGADRGSEPEPGPGLAGPTLWRVTCFVVARQQRRRGVAGLALRETLAAIRRRGGGVVEGYPIASWSHGPAGTSAAVLVAGAGLVGPAWGSFGNVSTPGTVSMFEREGFTAVAVLGSTSARVRATGAGGTQVLMRRVV